MFEDNCTKSRIKRRLVMSINEKINIIFSCFTIAVAVITLLLTIRQIRLSNKHRLLDRRLDQYHILKELLVLYDNERTFLIKNDYLYQSVSNHIIFLTNTYRLNSLASIIENPEGNIEKINFLSKCEELERCSLEIELFWKDKNSYLLSKFIKVYVKLLKALYHQHIIINKIKLNNKYNSDNKNKYLMEWARVNLIYESIEEMESCYEKLLKNNVEQRFIASMRID